MVLAYDHVQSKEVQCTYYIHVYIVQVLSRCEQVSVFDCKVPVLATYSL